MAGEAAVGAYLAAQAGYLDEDLAAPDRAIREGPAGDLVTNRRTLLSVSLKGETDEG
jgi:hypothetical protein